MAKSVKPAADKTASNPISASDALIQEAMKKQEIARAIAISRAADFTGEGAASAPARAAKKSKSAAEAPSGIVRRPALEGREAAGLGVRVSVLEPASRASLRAPASSVAALSKVLGLKLPVKPKTSAAGEGRVALWLGPDEWLVIDEDGGDLLADSAKVDALHSAVDISHRNVALSVSGANAEATLNAGCPQDLSLAAFPVGACSRTILGKVEIVLLRVSESEFRVECWRSFSDYVFAFLSDAAKDAAA